MSALLLLTSVHNALICTPFTAVVSRFDRHERIVATRGFYLLQLLAVGVAGVALGIGAYLWTASALLGAATALAIVGTGTREFRRTEYFLREDLRGLLLTDGITVLVGLTLLAIGIGVAGGLTASVALIAVGASGLATGIRRHDATGGGGSVLRVCADAWSQARAQARWTFPWTLVSWVQNSSYPYLIALTASAAAVADAGAARLMIMPVTLFSVGWNRLFFARAGRRLTPGSRGDVWGLATRGAGMLGGIVVAYGAAAIFLSWVQEGALLPSKYRHLTDLVVAWSLYFLVTTVRGVGSSALLAHQEARSLFRISAVAALVSLPLGLLLGRRMGPDGLILGITGGETAVAISVWSTLAGLERGTAGGIQPREETRAA